MGNTGGKPLNGSTKVAKRIHHIWVGSRVAPKELDYAGVWAGANTAPASPGGEQPARYRSTLWVDPNALLVNDVKKELLLWAESKALKTLGITDVATFDVYMSTRENRRKFLSTQYIFASRKRYALAAEIAHLPSSHLNDGARAAAILDMRADRLGHPVGRAERDLLLGKLADDRAAVIRSIKEGESKDINVVLNLPQYKLMRQAYAQELNLRQNLAAAADIARVLVLKHEGGVYADLDLLPQFKDEAFISIVRALESEGYVLPLNNGRRWSAAGLQGTVPDWRDIPESLVGAITDAVVERLGLIAGYEPSRSYEIDPKRLPDDPVRAKKMQQRQAAILRDVVDRVISHEYPGRYDIFKSLGSIVPPMGFELGCYRRFQDGKSVLMVNNQFIVSADQAFIDSLYGAIELNYRFLLDPGVAHYLKISSTGYSTSGVDAEMKILWLRIKGEDAPQVMFDAMKTYMADGIYPEAISTVVISGPEVYREVAEKVIAASALDEYDYDWLEAQMYESQLFNAQTSDGAESSWLARGKTIAQLRARHYPDAPPQETLADAADATWAPPHLAVERAPEHNDTFNYHHQIVIQIDGDEVALRSAQALFGKHPDKSMFARLRDGVLDFRFASQADQRLFAHSGAGQFLRGGAIRLSFVGHGRIKGDKVEFGRRTPEQFLSELAYVLEQGGVSSTNKLVINLVGCNLDSVLPRVPTSFADQLARSLPFFLAQFGVAAEQVELHARAGALVINNDGRKSIRHVAYIYREGGYVREGRLVDVQANEMDSFAGGGRPRPDIADFQSLALVRPSEQSPEFSPEGPLNVVLGWMTGAQDRQSAASLFNDDPCNSVFIALPRGTRADETDAMRNARTVYFDHASSDLLVRDGLSALADHRANVNLSVVGRATGSPEAPLFNGTSPAQFVHFLDDVLLRLVGRAHGSPSAEHLTLTLQGAGSDDPMLAGSDTFVGQMSEILLERLHAMGASAQRVELVTRDGRMLTGPHGEPRYVTSKGVTLRGELAAVYEQIASASFHYNATSGRFERVPATTQALALLSQRLNALHGREDLTLSEKAHLAYATSAYLKILRHSMGAAPITSQRRDTREQLIAAVSDALALRQQRLAHLSSLQGHPGEGWKIVPELVEENPNGPGYRLGFVEPDEQGRYALTEGHVKWVQTQDDVFMRWARAAKELGAVIVEGLTRRRTGKYEFLHPSESGAAHTISAAFLLQTLIGPQDAYLSGDDDAVMAALAGKHASDLTAQDRKTLAPRVRFIRAQTAVNYAQLTAGVASDGLDLIRLVAALRTSSSGLALLSKTVGVLGASFDIANVVFASIQLANARNTRQKTEAGANLGVSLVAAGMSIGGLSSAGLAQWLASGEVGEQWAELAVGAGAVGETLGVLSVPVVGLGIGVTEVIRAFDDVAERVDDTLHRLMRAVEAAQPDALGYTNGALRFSKDLVASDLDLSTGALRYGSVRVRGLKRYSRLVAPTHSDEMLDLYAPFLGPAGTRTLTRSQGLDSEVIVLPSGLARDYEYALVASPGWRYNHEFPLLETLENAYPGKFYWWTYRQAAGMFGWDYSPADLRVSYRDTPFNLTLDEHNRTIVIPSLEASAHREKLHYTLHAGGADYIVVLPAWKVDLQLVDHAVKRGRWELDLTHAVYPAKLVDGKMTYGEMAADQLRRIEVTRTGVAIDGIDWVTFAGKTVHDLTLFVDLDVAGASRLVMRGAQDASATTGATTTGLLESWLQVERSAQLDAEHLVRLSQALTHGGLDGRRLRIQALDGAAGVLDLATNQAVWATFDPTKQSSTLYVDAVAIMTLPARHAMEVGFDAQDVNQTLVVKWHVKDGLDAYLRYKHAEMVGAHVHASGVQLRRHLPDPQHYLFPELAPWIAQLPKGQDVVVSNDSAEQFEQLDFNGDGVDGVLSYTCAHEGLSITFDFIKARAIIRIHAAHSFSVQALMADADLLNKISTVEIWVADQQGARTAVDLNALSRLLEGKHITLISSTAVDLTLPGKRFSWDVNDGDLVMQSDDRTAIRWLGMADGSDSSHTLAFDDAPARPLAQALAGHGFHDFKLHLVDHDAGTDLMTWLDEVTRHRLEQEHTSIDLTRDYYVGAKDLKGVQIVLDADMRQIFSMQKDWKQPGYIAIYKDGAHMLSVPERCEPIFKLDANRGDPRVVLAMKSDDGTTVNYQYQDTRLTDVIIYRAHVSPGDFQQLLEARTQHVSRLEPEYAARIFDAQGNRATASITAGAVSIETFAGVDHGASLFYQRQGGRVEITRGTGVVIDVAGLDILKAFGDRITEFDISLGQPVDVKQRVRIDLSNPAVAGKKFTLSGGNALDLEVLGSKVSWKKMGGDVLLYQHDELVMICHGAASDQASKASIKVGNQPAMSWADLLRGSPLHRAHSRDVALSAPFAVRSGHAAVSERIVAEQRATHVDAQIDVAGRAHASVWATNAQRLMHISCAYRSEPGVPEGTTGSQAVQPLAPALSLVR